MVMDEVRLYLDGAGVVKNEERLNTRTEYFKTQDDTSSASFNG
jgi:hypothetical protein